MRDTFESDSPLDRFSALVQGLSAPGEARRTLDVNAIDPVERLDVLLDEGESPIGEPAADLNVHHTRHQHGGQDEVATATPAANAIPKADAAGSLDIWITAPPTHATSHEAGGDDEVTVDHGDLTGLDGDDHTQYLDIAGTRAMTGTLDVEGTLTLRDGSDDHDITIARANVASARTYTVPEAGADADFVMTAGTQIIAGNKTLSGTTSFSGQATGAQYSATGYLTGAQTIGHNSTTTVNWSSTSLVGITHASGTFTLPADGAGTYIVTGQLMWAAYNGGVRLCAVVKNAANMQRAQINPSVNAAISQGFQLQIVCANSDTIKIVAYQDTGGNLDLTGGEQYTQIQIRRLV